MHEHDSFDLEMATPGSFEACPTGSEDAMRRTDEQFNRIDMRLDQIGSLLDTLERRTRHESLRSWTLTGVVSALIGLLAWLCREQLALGWQASF